MDDSQLMSVFNGIRQLNQPVRSQCTGNRLLFSLLIGDPLREIRAAAIGGKDVVDGTDFSRFINRHDIGMDELCSGAGLFLKILLSLRSQHDVTTGNLECRLACEVRIKNSEDHAMSADTQTFQNSKTPKRQWLRIRKKGRGC